MIEDELRSLLTERADEVVDGNAGRVGDVHARVGAIRRRRTVAATLALVLIVAAGVLFTRLPGRPETLPTGVPAGPYFDRSTPADVPGYRGQQFFTFTGEATWSAAATPGDRVIVLVARCDDRGDLDLRNVSSAVEGRLSCRVPVGDHYEGALRVVNEEHGLLARSPSGANVTVRPGSAGSWTVGFLDALYPEHISAQELSGGLLDGAGVAAGKRLALTIPGDIATTHGMIISIVCVRDVRLEFLFSGHPLATVACTDGAVPVPTGLVTVEIPNGALTALGLRPLQRVSLEVRSTGRQTPEWAVIGVG